MTVLIIVIYDCFKSKPPFVSIYKFIYLILII